MSDSRQLYGVGPTKAQAREDFIKRASAYFHAAGTVGIDNIIHEHKRQIVRGLLKTAGCTLKEEA